jgi:uncharacterized membrane protein HdeD (DUF308 family)
VIQQEELRKPLTDEGRHDANRFIMLGAAGIVLGVLGFLYVTAVTITSLVGFGIALVVAGVWHLVNAYKNRDGHGYFVDIPSGITETVVGALLLSKPGASLLGLTLVTAGFLLITGVLRMIYSATLKLPSWGVSFASGVISVVLGAMIWAEWPISSVWVLGAFVSAYLITSGASFLAMGLTVRREFPKLHPAT